MKQILSQITGISLLVFTQAVQAQTAPAQPVRRPVPARAPRRPPVVQVSPAQPADATDAAQQARTPAGTQPATDAQTPATTTATTAATDATQAAAATQTAAVATTTATTAPSTAPVAVPTTPATPVPAATPTAPTDEEDDEQTPAPSPAPPVIVRTAPVPEEPPPVLRIHVGPQIIINAHPVESMRMYSRSWAAGNFGLWVSLDLQQPTSRLQASAEIGWNFEQLSAPYAGIFTAEMSNHYLYAGGSARYAVREWFMPYARATVGSVLSIEQIASPQSVALKGLSPSFGGTLGVGLLVQGRVFPSVGLFLALEGGGMAFSNTRVVLREDPPADMMIAQERITTSPVTVGDANLSGFYGRLAFGLQL